MKTVLKKLYAVINLYRAIPSLILYCLNKKLIKEDVERYLVYTPYKKPSFMATFYTLLVQKPFRSIFYYRTKKNFILTAISKLFIRPLESIEIITGDIKGGFHIIHKYGCVICVTSAGKNFTVAQGSTVGYGKKDEEGRRSPIIGDNVWISANATVFGPITIGNDVLIGSGCVLNKSVPDNCTVVGNPARIVKKDGVKCDELL